MRKKLCIMCEKEFLRGWLPKFHAEGIDTKGYGVCETCLKRLYPTDVSELEREEELIGIFLDWVEQELNTLDKHELAQSSLSKKKSQ